MSATPSFELSVTDKSSSGCGCCATSAAAPVTPAADGLAASYGVTGLTCGSCAARVSSAVNALDHVTDVAIDLVKGGTSTVTVHSDQPVPAAAIRAAVEGAGYQLQNN